MPDADTRLSVHFNINSQNNHRIINLRWERAERPTIFKLLVCLLSLPGVLCDEVD